MPLKASICVANSTRWYRGESGDMKKRSDVLKGEELEKDEITKREEALLKTAMPRAESIYERHIRLPTLESIPQSSLPPSFFKTQTEVDDQSQVQNQKQMDDGPVLRDLGLEVRKKRLVYRSKQRGWLEVDLLLGTWANENVPNLSSQELDEFEAFVNMETIDIYNIITLRLDIPKDMKTKNQTSVMERIQAWARASPLGKANLDTYVEMKKKNNLI
eukprot:CAMPEP_0184855180 /NCGR_PEP_ID=MMETSP0580-20130426/493_1 /TAXON_ID=1118495 /ORGANISM="Dactyliosolen fragilissimus" /LENGTH=216 /DNA_ID=CAMNT_0027349631 /DNA_START=96 /DNA_END=746 /DNA_ORIENTATION=-